MRSPSTGRWAISLIRSPTYYRYSAPIKFTDTGNQPLIFTGTNYASNVTTPFSLASAASNGCLLGSANAIPAAGNCLVDANFSPTVAGTDTDTIFPVTNAANNSNVSAVLSGLAIHLTSSSTTINVTSPTTTSYYYGQTLTVTATTTLAANVGTPAGSFIFTVDGSQQPPIPFGATGTYNDHPYRNDNAVQSDRGGALGQHQRNIYRATVSVRQQRGFTQLLRSEGADHNRRYGSAILFGSQGVDDVYGDDHSCHGFGRDGNSQLLLGHDAAESVANHDQLGHRRRQLRRPSAYIFPSNSFTAVYSGDSNFSGSTSSALQPGGNFNLTTPTTVVNIPQGGNITNSIVLTPYFGYSGTVTPTCSGLPAYSTCTFQPVSAVVSGTAQIPFTIYVYTSTNVTAENRQGLAGSRVTWAILSPLGLLTLAFVRRRRLLGRRVLITLLIALSLGTAASLSGCTNAVEKSYSYVVTPPGSDSVTVTLRDNNAPSVSHSINFTLNVCNINVGTTCQTSNPAWACPRAHAGGMPPR